MSVLNWISAIGTMATTIGLVAAGVWAWLKLRTRREHVPRIDLDIDIEFIARTGDQWLVMLVLTMVNAGLVRYTLENGSWDLRCAYDTDKQFEESDGYGRLRLPHPVAQGSWLEEADYYLFLEPNEKMRRKVFTTVPGDARLLQLIFAARNRRKDGNLEKLDDVVVVAAPDGMAAPEQPR
ncbi:MAG TPA: hypothetical protein VI142_09155 [Gaiellaceae bacterium]